MMIPQKELLTLSTNPQIGLMKKRGIGIRIKRFVFILNMRISFLD